MFSTQMMPQMPAAMRLALAAVTCCAAHVGEAREVTLKAHALRHHELTHVTALHAETGEPRQLRPGQHHSRLDQDEEPSWLMHARELRYSFTALGRAFEIQLEMNDDLIGAKFVHASSSGARNETRVTALADVEYCYFRGKLVDEPTSQVAVHTCGEGIEASIRTESGEHIVTMPASRVAETRVGAAAAPYDPSLGELPQHVVFRTSDHQLWKTETHDCEKGELWKESVPLSPEAARHVSSARPAPGFSPTGGCTCKASWGFSGVWYGNGGCQVVSMDAVPFCFTEEECGHGGGNAWTPCLDAMGHSATSSRRRMQAGAALVPITKHVELTMVNDASQFEAHEAGSSVTLSTFDQDAALGARTQTGVGGETRPALELTLERSMQLANSVNVAYRSMNQGIGITLVAVRTYEDTAAEQAENLNMNAVGESIGDYLDKLSTWRRDVQNTLLDGSGISLSSDNTALITARDMLSTANDATTNGVAGLAGVGTMCNAMRSSNVVSTQAICHCLCFLGRF